MDSKPLKNLPVRAAKENTLQEFGDAVIIERSARRCALGMIPSLAGGRNDAQRCSGWFLLSSFVHDPYFPAIT